MRLSVLAREGAIALCTLLAVGCPGPTESPPTATGTWQGQTAGPLTDRVFLLLTQQGSSVTGTVLYARPGTPGDTGLVAGTVSGDTVTATLTLPGSACTVVMTMVGVLNTGSSAAAMPGQLLWGAPNSCTSELGASITWFRTVSGPPAPVASVIVTPPAAMLGVGGSLQLTASARSASGIVLVGHRIAWQSGSPGTIPVADDGTATGLTPGGPVLITASTAGVSGSASLSDTAATFDHAATGQALAGSHAVPPAGCLDCHAGGVLAGSELACYACHQATYAATTNPAHDSAGFGTTCWECHHSLSVWTGAVFAHTQFNVAHHAATCAQCHTTSLYAEFSCRGCHGDHHNRGYTDVWCYQCHAY